MIINFLDIITLIYGVMGFILGWLWGRHQSMAASFVASIIAAVVGFAIGNVLGWVSVSSDMWADKLAQQYKTLGSSVGLVINVVWWAVVVVVPIVAIGAFRKSDRQAAAQANALSHRDSYR
jgi:large-conductance mechanosensitive channel